MTELLQPAGGLPGQRTAAGPAASVGDVATPTVRRQRIEPVDPRTFTTLLEQLQEGYVAAVAASAGCILELIKRDVWGFDGWIIRPPVRIGAGEEIMIGVQLKNTTQIKPDHTKESFSYQFKERKYFDALAIERRMHKVLALVMAAPPQQVNWTSLEEGEGLRIDHCCYWANLEGSKAKQDVAQPTVRIPTANVFDGPALRAIMDRAARGEVL